PTKPA
ncbi:unnamed protein product, partial [Allacma fusca]